MASRVSNGPTPVKPSPAAPTPVKKIAVTEAKRPGQAPGKALPIRGVKFVYSTPLHYRITVIFQH